MESLPKSPILKFHENTLLEVRKQYGLDKPGQMDAAIDILEEWVKKQNHIVKKDISRHYLERLIIFRKGSVERAKEKFDKICTFRTLLPSFFPKKITRNDFANVGFQVDAILPGLTDDFHRIYIIKNPQIVTLESFTAYFRYLMLLWEYVNANDYCTGIHIICDFTVCSMLDLVKVFNPVEVRNVMSLLTDGYSMRLKAIHFLTYSKTIDVIITIMKQVVSEKIGNRIYVHKNVESLCEHVPRKLLPVEYGGEEKPLIECHNEVVDTIFSEEFITYASQMTEVCTDESLRRTDKFNEQYMGTPGSFRALHVD